MKIKFDFVPQGAVIKIEDGKFNFKSWFQGKETLKEWDQKTTVIFDTGNHLGDNIIDHHQPGTEDSCVAMLVALSFEKFINQLDRTAEEITFITHFFPDFDAIGSTYLAKFFLENGKMPDHVDVIGEYINEVDSGKLTLDPIYPVNPASMILGISDEISGNNEIPFPAKHEAILEKSYKLMDEIFRICQKSPNPWMPDFCDEIQEFDVTKEKIHNDAKTYKEDFERSNYQTLKLKNNFTGIIESVDFIATSVPKSFLWKYWVRGDRINSPLNQGFILTCAFFDTFKEAGRNRAIIATDPNTPYALKGLGLLIESFECRALLNDVSKEDLTKDTRPGFHRGDPWYDGRAPVHNFTIIDAPRAGSVLSNEQLLDAIRRYELWQFVGNNFDNLATDFDKLVDIDSEELDITKNIGLDLLLDNFKNLEFAEIEQSFNEINLILKKLRNTVISNDYVEIKRESIRKKILNTFIDFYNIIPKSEIRKWSSRLTDTIIDFLPVEFLVEWLLLTNDLDYKPLKRAFEKALVGIPEEKIYPLLLKLHSNHFDGFEELAEEAVPGKILFEKINEKTNTLLTNFIEYLDIEPTTNFVRETLPVYSFNRIKNYFDDIFVSSEFAKQNKLSEELNKFICTDLKELINDEKLVKLWDSQSTFKNSFEKFVSSEIIIKRFGENLTNVRKLRAELLASPSGKHFGKYKKYNPEEYLKLGFLEIKECYEYFNRMFAEKDEKQSEFILFLKILLDVASFKSIAARTSMFFHLKSLNNDEVNKEFLLSHHNDLLSFQELLEILFEMTLKMQLNLEKDDFTESLNSIIDKINFIKTLNRSTFIDLTDIMENINKFVANIISELELKSSQIDDHLKVAFSQYEDLTDANGIIAEINKLPLYYQTILNEITCSFKKYYIEKINLIQTDLREVTNSNSEIKGERYVHFTSEILNKTVFFDWYNLKALVDNSNNPDLIAKYYKKYFYWLELNNQFNKDQLQDSESNKLRQFNSELRFIIGAKLIENINLIDELKIDNEKNTDIYNDILLKDFSYDTIQNHYIYPWLIDVYEYLNDLYLEKYDIDNVSKSLEQFSTGYPKYLKILTKTSVIRMIVLVLIAFLVGVGIFDAKTYEPKEKEAPKTEAKADIPTGKEVEIKVIVKEINTPNGITIDSTIEKTEIVADSATAKTITKDDDKKDEKADDKAGMLSPAANFIKSTFGEGTLSTINYIFSAFWINLVNLIFVVPLLLVFFKIITTPFKRKEKKEGFITLFKKIENKKTSLLYLNFIPPLILVVLQMANGDVVKVVNSITGFRFISITIVIITLILFSLEQDIEVKNEGKSKKWISKKASHMFWLYFLQSLVITIFMVEIFFKPLVEAPASVSEMFNLGISKTIEIKEGFLGGILNSIINIDDFTITIMPGFTILIALLSLFLSIFIDKLFNNE